MRCDRCDERIAPNDSHECRPSKLVVPALTHSEVKACKLLAHALFCTDGCRIETTKDGPTSRGTRVRDAHDTVALANPTHWRTCSVGAVLREEATP